jgi:outer membrane protein
MKVFRIIAAVAAIGAFAIFVQTQTRPAIGSASVAVIDTGAFSEVTGGITRVVNAMKQIEAKFTPLRNEIRGMQTRLSTMRTDLQKKQGLQDAKLTAQQADQADQLEIQIKRKAEDAQASYQKESLAALEPLHKDIAGALNAYAQSKGISILIDVNRVPVVYAASNVDITKDFIAEYNRTHPATTAPAPARP